MADALSGSSRSGVSEPVKTKSEKQDCSEKFSNDLAADHSDRAPVSLPVVTEEEKAASGDEKQEENKTENAGSPENSISAMKSSQILKLNSKAIRSVRLGLMDIEYPRSKPKLKGLSTPSADNRDSGTGTYS